MQFSKEARAEAADGRLILIFATDTAREPRFQVNGSVTSAQIFGVDVNGMEPAVPIQFDADVFGFPRANIWPT